MIKQHLIEERKKQIVQSFSTQSGAMAIAENQGFPCFQSSHALNTDLSFQLLIEEEQSTEFLQDLDWLADIQHVAFSFSPKNTRCHVIFSDSVYCDFKVTTTSHNSENQNGHFQTLWHKPNQSLPSTWLNPNRSWGSISNSEQERLLAEILTSILVGLRHFIKGDKLSAFHFVQHSALLKMTELMTKWHVQQEILQGENVEQAFQKHYPLVVGTVSQFAMGFERTPEAALAMVECAERHFTVNYFLMDQILNLIKSTQSRT